MNESIQPGARDFATTRWSMVPGAHGSGPDAQRAMAALCQGYWYPLYAYVRRQGHAPHDAQDLTQEFFARLIEKGWLGGVAPEREISRMAPRIDETLSVQRVGPYAREKRGSGAVLLSIDEDTAESRYLREPVGKNDAELLYDRRWALTLLDRVMARLRDKFMCADKRALFEAIKGTLTGDAPVDADIALTLHSTEGAVKVAVHRLARTLPCRHP